MAKINKDITGVILSGGKSSRFGSNKAFACLQNDKPIIENILHTLVGQFLNNLLIVKDEDKYLYLKKSGVYVVHDLFSDSHSLGGIYTALKYAETPYIFVCACDMPFIKPDLLSALFENCEGYDAIIPNYNNSLQPLCGIYAKTCIEPIKRMIDANCFRIKNLFKNLQVRLFTQDDVKQIDPFGISFIDIDTASDFTMAKNLNV